MSRYLILFLCLLQISACFCAFQSIQLRQKKSKDELIFRGREIQTEYGVTLIERQSTDETVIGGGIETTSPYFFEIQVGSQNAFMKIVLDTGSSNLYIAGKSCADAGQSNGQCQHPNDAYDPTKSITSRAISCNTNNITCTCGTQSSCQVQSRYGGGARVVSSIYQDTVKVLLATETSINGSLDVNDAYFGVITSVSNDRFPQSNFFGDFDGICGFAYRVLATGNVPPLFDSILGRGDYENTFGLCLESNGGVMTLGGEDPGLYTGPLSFTPLANETWYSVDVSDMIVNGVSLASNGIPFDKYRIIVDSGTTLLWVPPAVFKQMRIAMQKNCTDLNTGGSGTGYYYSTGDTATIGDDSARGESFSKDAGIRSNPDPMITRQSSTFDPYNFICSPYATSIFNLSFCLEITEQEVAQFPSITFQFPSINGGTFDVEFPPTKYLRKAVSTTGTVCYASAVISNYDTNLMILGGAWMRGLYTVFDRELGTVGFAQASPACQRSLPVTSSTSSTAVSAPLPSPLLYLIVILCLVNILFL